MDDLKWMDLTYWWSFICEGLLPMGLPHPVLSTTRFKIHFMTKKNFPFCLRKKVCFIQFSTAEASCYQLNLLFSKNNQPVKDIKGPGAIDIYA